MIRDFEKYIVQLQKQYNDMSKAMAEAQELAASGKLSQETAEAIVKNTEIIKANYQRVLFCRHLIALPPKFIINLKKRYWDIKEHIFKITKSDKESVLAENEQSLDEIKAMVKENE